jgi:hypothetical protein
VCGVLEQLLPSADSCKDEDAPQATCDVLAPLLASCPIGSRVRKHSRAGLFAAVAKRLAKVNRHIRARARQACRAVATSLATINQHVSMMAHAQRAHRALTTSLATINRHVSMMAHAQRAHRALTTSLATVEQRVRAHAQGAHRTVAAAASAIERAHVVASVSLLVCLGCVVLTVVWHCRHTNM